MTLDELKKRATASELTLIEATEKTLRKEVIRDVTTRLVNFIGDNPPPSREDHKFDQSAGRRWSERLAEALDPEPTTTKPQ
jgi:hypothetical protein